MNNIDWSQLRSAADIAAEKETSRLAPLIAEEVKWVEQERSFVSVQLEALEDGEKIPGTERQWRDHRILVRAWQEGAEYYPDSRHRPVRPS